MTHPADPFAAPKDRPRNGLGIAALVLGIAAALLSVTVIGGVLLGVLALVFGQIGRRRARRGEATNDGVALGGLVAGILSIVLSIALLVVGVSLLNTKAGRTYRACLQQAGSNSGAVQACARQFSQQLGR